MITKTRDSLVSLQTTNACKLGGVAGRGYADPLLYDSQSRLYVSTNRYSLVCTLFSNICSYLSSLSDPSYPKFMSIFIEDLPSTPAKVPVALISGHIDLSSEDFEKHYIPQINTALQAGHCFVIGDAVGVDTLALTHLLSPRILQRYPDIKSRITVYPSRKHNIAKLTSQGFKVVRPDDPSLKVERTVVVVERKGNDVRRYHHIQRDANMTAATDYDILYVRSDEESRRLHGDKWWPRLSATEMNRMRRAELARMKAEGNHVSG